MTMFHMVPAALLATALTIIGGTVEPGHDGQKSGAELAYADAPHGVDAMVTGPVSASFRQQQQIAGCDTATWPDIPLACFPQ